MPMLTAMGVARPRAQGQAAASTATLYVSAAPKGEWNTSSQIVNVAAEAASISGVKIAETLSTNL